jgi:LysM repeat protein
MRKLLPSLLIIFLLLKLSFSPGGARAVSIMAPYFSPASDLIDAVNALRTAQGLPALEVNSILMTVAQQQADYNLAIQMMTDSSPDGLRPYQRALLAGYAVAGDISRGGFYTELLYAGRNTSSEEAISWWNNDPPHQAMLLSTVFMDVGAGVATSGGTSYYVLVAGKSTGGTPVPFTPPASYNPPKPTMIPNTPNADGSIFYSVQPGDTLGMISITYDVSVSDLRALNNLVNDIIYTDKVLTIRGAYTPTPTPPTSTPTGHPTITPWPTSTLTATETRIPPTPTRSPRLPVSAAHGAVITIVVAALVLAALLVLLIRKRN